MVIVRAMTAMTAMTAVHEEMHADADQQRQQKGERPEQVRPMLQPQEEPRNEEKDAQGEDSRAAPRSSLPTRDSAHLDAPEGVFDGRWDGHDDMPIVGMARCRASYASITNM
jgi:hypothetical protein